MPARAFVRTATTAVSSTDGLSSSTGSSARSRRS
jgi:hypothetical protein